MIDFLCFINNDYFIVRTANRLIYIDIYNIYYNSNYVLNF